MKFKVNAVTLKEQLLATVWGEEMKPSSTADGNVRRYSHPDQSMTQSPLLELSGGYTGQPMKSSSSGESPALGSGRPESSRGLITWVALARLPPLLIP